MNKDYAVTLDKSGSIGVDVTPGYTRLQQDQEYIGAITKFANQYDPNRSTRILWLGI